MQLLKHMKTNQINMEEKLFDNAKNIRVVWEDYPENITQEKTKDIRQYFAKKYSSSNVQVITKIKNDNKILQTVDVSSNILDVNYQNNLIKKMLEANKLKKANKTIIIIKEDDFPKESLTKAKREPKVEPVKVEPKVEAVAEAPVEAPTEAPTEASSDTPAEA